MKIITKENFIYLTCFLFSLIGILSLFESFNEIDNELQSNENLFKERLKLISSFIFFPFIGISYYLITKNKSKNTFKLIAYWIIASFIAGISRSVTGINLDLFLISLEIKTISS